jgi:hypothetical protein
MLQQGGKCHGCNATGHWIAKCPERKCRTCAQRGHSERECNKDQSSSHGANQPRRDRPNNCHTYHQEAQRPAPRDQNRRAIAVGPLSRSEHSEPLRRGPPRGQGRNFRGGGPR